MTEENAIYEERSPDGRAVPLIVSVPHAGTLVPGVVAERFAGPHIAALPMTGVAIVAGYWPLRGKLSFFNPGAPCDAPVANLSAWPFFKELTPILNPIAMPSTKKSNIWISTLKKSKPE